VKSIFAILPVVFMALSAQAEEVVVAADLGIFSQHVTRGLSYTDGKPAVQGDVAVVYDNITTWVWFSNAYPSPEAKFAERDVIELDWGIDYAGQAGAVGYGIGARYYTYQFDAQSNFPEANVSLTFDAPLAPSLTAFITLADSKNKAVLAGDLWLEAAWSKEMPSATLSFVASYAHWATDALNRPDQNYFKDGLALASLGVSKNISIGDVVLTPSLKATFPLISDSADGHPYIYGLPVERELIFGFNLSY